MRSWFQSSVAGSAKYRPDIDGLRALAVLPVILFHAKIPGFSGGYVGVDIFFVISGYLITSILLRDLENQRFSIATFYERRIRRIFPALFAVLLFSTLIAAALFAPSDFAAFGKGLISVTAFVSNFVLLRGPEAAGYFDRAADWKPFLHAWSLAIEEQFYLFFPIALFMAFRWFRHRLVAALVGASLLSFAANILLTKYRPAMAFYMLPPRAWELLLGSLLAARAIPHVTRRSWREAAGILGLVMIVGSVAAFSNDTVFPGFAALLPCLGATLVIYSGESGDCFSKRVLSSGILVLFGVISYSLYLWHWPLIVFGRFFVSAELDGPQTAVVLALSFVFAMLSFVFVESPFRSKRFTRHQMFQFAAVAMTITVAAGVSIQLTEGVPGRFDAATRQLVLRNFERQSDYQDVCTNYKVNVQRWADVNVCSMGPEASHKIFFWGDSHVQQLYPAVNELYKHGDLASLSVRFAVANGCPPTEHMNNTGNGYHCDSFASVAMRRAAEPDIDTVFIAFNTDWTVHPELCDSVEGRCIGDTLPTSDAAKHVFAELDSHIKKLKTLGKKIVLSLPFPMYNKSIPKMQVHNALFSRFGLGDVASDITLPSIRRQMEEIAHRHGAVVFDPRRSLCPDNRCLTDIEGVSIYKDDHHIAESQIGIFKNDLRAAFYKTNSFLGSQTLPIAAIAPGRTSELPFERPIEGRLRFVPNLGGDLRDAARRLLE